MVALISVVTPVIVAIPVTVSVVTPVPVMSLPVSALLRVQSVSVSRTTSLAASETGLGMELLLGDLLSFGAF